ncbi:MAG TPA: RDD family protein [Anaerolineae bacterium]|nr:RDD family protein [Anaerolineae bacterium]
MDSNEAFLQIDTPENVVFGYELAGLASRFQAALIDTIIIVIIQAILATLVFSFTINTNIAANIISAIMGLIAFTFLWGYYIFFEMLWNGQSIGKRAINIRVVNINGSPIGLTESIIRNLIRIIDILPATYGVGVITMFLNQKWRRLGDLAAGTVVVYDQQTINLSDLNQSQRDIRYLNIINIDIDLLSDLSLDTLTTADIELIYTFLQRSSKLTNKRELTTQIYDHIRQKLSLPPSESLPTMEKKQRWLYEIVKLYNDQYQPTDDK